MTLDEAIKHAKEVAEEQEKAAKEWHENQVRKCELISFAAMDYTHENECKECASEHRQLAEWLKELKQLREQTKWILCSEKMPEEKEWIGTKQFGTTISDKVFVTLENSKGERYTQYLSFQNGKLSTTDQSKVDTFFKGGTPIAWMPKPKPYDPQESQVSE